MKYTKLIARISNIITLEYEKMEAIAVSIEDTDLNNQLKEMVASRAVRRVCEELERELI